MTSLARTTPLFIVLNVGSGHGDADSARQEIGAILRAAGQAHEFVVVAAGDQLAAAAGKAVAAARQQGGAVIAAGGDGTINTVAQAVLEAELPFGVLPQGTFNYFGRAHGMPPDIAAATQALLRARIEQVQVGLVNNRVFLVNASIGLYPQVLEDRELFKRKFGRFRLVALIAGLVTLLRSYRMLHLNLVRDAQRQTLRTPTLFVGNNALQLRQIGIAEAEALPREFLVAVTPQPVRRLDILGLIVRGLQGQLGRAQAVDSFAFKTLTVDRLRHSRRRIKVATDGEVLWLQAPLQFRISPRALRLLVPSDTDKVLEAP